MLKSGGNVMQNRSINVTANGMGSQDQGNAKKVISTTPGDVDFSMFGTREIRDVLKSRAHCLRAGFSSNHIIIKTLNEIRDNYIQRVGLATYLSQMLGPIGKVPVEQCRLYGENGRQIEIQLNGNHTQPVQRFIASRFHWEALPTRVEVLNKANPSQVEVRYL